MSPAVDGGEDSIGGFGPDEWLGLVVDFRDETVDCGLKIDDRGESAAFEPLSGKLGEQALDCVGPGAGSRGGMKGEAPMPLQPGRDPRLREGRLFGCLWVA